MIKEIIVVEGKDDTVAVKRAVEADTIETGGSAIGAEVLALIRAAAARRGVIILTDPDHAGERIRRIVAEHVPGSKHAFLTKEEAMRLRGMETVEIGVEHASVEAIRRALAEVRTEIPNVETDIQRTDLLVAGLTAHPQAAERRRVIGNLLGIGHCNAKTFHQRCRMFQISREQFLAAVKQLGY